VTPRGRILSRVRVLIIDNSAAVRQRLLDLIRDCSGIERIWQAADATGALAIARAQPLDVALVDLALGQESGLDLILKLRVEQARLVLIVLTNSSTDAHREECLRRGAHYFFDKSHEFERAIAVIGEVASAAQDGV
jgi:DNA-binding NarL/FixJ family response regulator